MTALNWLRNRRFSVSVNSTHNAPTKVVSRKIIVKKKLIMWIEEVTDAFFVYVIFDEISAFPVITNLKTGRNNFLVGNTEKVCLDIP